MLSRSMGLIVVNILDLRAKLCRNAQKKRKSAAADIINNIVILRPWMLKLVDIKNIDLKCIYSLINKISDIDRDNETDGDNRDDKNNKANKDNKKSSSYTLENTECEKVRK
ncbi:hypothetical protein CIRG_08214 [Coccidioides immitis RMSCC 2394]|uniref:Uncharacterized protein n=1 Tax=Coccidioides immitis RMSCC 2394 TaxID=404692 RepID=A0A0J6YNQ4_COCIT|nr:hypothetical protein CIRG_08214 [Coccidioides immitis RMSCC 2394]